MTKYKLSSLYEAAEELRKLGGFTEAAAKDILDKTTTDTKNPKRGKTNVEDKKKRRYSNKQYR